MSITEGSTGHDEHAPMKQRSASGGTKLSHAGNNGLKSSFNPSRNKAWTSGAWELGLTAKLRMSSQLFLNSYSSIPIPFPCGQNLYEGFLFAVVEFKPN